MSRTFSFCIALLFSLSFFGVETKPLIAAVDQQDSLSNKIHNVLLQWSKDPKNEKLMIQLAGLYFRKGETDSAQYFLDFVEKIVPDNYLVPYWRGRIFLKKGEFKIIPLERLLELLKQDNFSRAIRSFQKTIKLKPDFLDGHYYLGLAHFKKGGDDHLTEAIAVFSHLLELQPDFRDTEYQLGRVYQRLEQYPKAISYFNQYFDHHPDDYRPFIELSRIYLHTGNTKQASNYFMSGVVKLRNEEMLENLFLEIQDIASDEEKKEFESLPLEKKGLFFQKFWKSRDPTPFTDENERFTEHFQRVELARELYPIVVPPYYDDRGRIYVKYGPPDDRYVSNMTAGQSKDNESWSYERTIGKGVVFDFVNYGGIYRLVQDLTEAAPPGLTYEQKKTIAGELYRQRAGDLGGVYHKFSLSFRDTDFIDFVNETSAARQAAPPDRTKYKYDSEPLPFFLSFAQFKAQNHKTRLEIYHSVPSRFLSFEKLENGALYAALDISVGVYDSFYNQIALRKYASDLTLPSEKDIQRAINIDQTNIELTPGQEYTLIVKVEAGQKMGLFKRKFFAKTFLEDSLQVSDLELATKIEATSRRNQFFKKGLKVVPYTFNRVNKNTPLKLYFEIYNLKKSDDKKTHYQIEYKITTLKRNQSPLKKMFRTIGSIFSKAKKESIALSYTREGNQAMASEYISLDIQKMPPGIHELLVSIKDLVSGQEKAVSVKLDFVKP